jgi:hypothetical protein
LSGIGIRLLQEMMKDERPIAAVVGSEDTRALVPRLGWTSLGSVRSYALPLRGSALTARLEARGIPPTLGRLAFDVFGRHWYARRSFDRPHGGEVLRLTVPGDEVAQPHFSPKMTGPIPDPSWLRWICQHPASGQVGTLYFSLRGELVGWSTWRVTVGPGRLRHGAAHHGMILDLRVRGEDPSLYRWALGETIETLDRLNVDRVNTRAASAVLEPILVRRGFVALGEGPVWIWLGRGAGAPAGPLELRLDTADSGLMPYQEKWP